MGLAELGFLVAPFAGGQISAIRLTRSGCSFIVRAIPEYHMAREIGLNWEIGDKAYLRNPGIKVFFMAIDNIKRTLVQLCHPSIMRSMKALDSIWEISARSLGFISFRNLSLY